MPLTERDINVPRQRKTQTPPAHKTPQPQSKLPRFVATPNSAPAAARWTSRVADPPASVERTAGAISHTPTYRRDPPAVASGQKVHKPGPIVKDKPLPQEKALPPRPLARLSTDPSPSKDGRCLIDACEQPLHIASISGDKHEWPALRPQLSRSPSATPPSESHLPEVKSESPAHSSAISAASAMAAATELTNTIVGKVACPKRDSKRSSHSLASSYVSANECASQIAASCKSYGEPSEPTEENIIDQHRRTFSNASTNTDLPMRKASLRSRISNGSLITPTVGSRNQVMTLTDFTRAETASPASTASRPHSPSPASFSRPRPGSGSHAALSTRTMKTASRIPIPDSKKATVVDVKKDQSATPTLPRNTGLPTFGSRRLASPDALKILENGKMRRQMQRTPTTASSNPNMRACNQESDPAEVQPPSSSYSVRSGGEAQHTSSNERRTFDSISSDDNDDEAPSPSDKSSHFPKAIYRTSRSMQAVPAFRETFRDGSSAASRAPPQTSPFVAPLETIHSEAVLSLDANCLNDETREELIKTLSHLEGKGSPPKFDVDNETLLHMFGHLKKGVGRNAHNSSILAQNAAAAEKFLAIRGSSILEVKGLEDGIGAANRAKKQPADETQDDELQPCTMDKKQTIISKWSTSTPSDKALSPPSDDICTAVQPPSVPKSRPKTPSLSHPASIGYPSRIPSKATTTNLQTADDAATIASIPSRRSSPTLSKRKPGSVRAAREGLQIANASFARTTASAESRKTLRTPNPANRAFSIPDDSQRGRMTTIEKPRSRSDGLALPKVPRSRSKSRYVLDKINGLFSGKRDKRSVAIPPVPRIEENGASVESQEAATSNSPPPRPVQAARLPKMPSSSPPAQSLPRSHSRTTMRTDDTTLVDRISMKDETQCVQVLSEHLVGKARSEVNPQRKERLLTFAKVLNDSLISVREAAISAETAQHAAKSAQVSYEMTQRSLAMVQRLAATMARTGVYNRQ